MGNTLATRGVLRKQSRAFHSVLPEEGSNILANTHRAKVICQALFYVSPFYGREGKDPESSK